MFYQNGYDWLVLLVSGRIANNSRKNLTPFLNIFNRLEKTNPAIMWGKSTTESARAPSVVGIAIDY